LYILAWKSFAINQYLYIQNCNPFVISESPVYTGGGTRAPDRSKPRSQPGPDEADQTSRNRLKTATERRAVSCLPSRRKISMSRILRSGEAGLPINLLQSCIVKPAAAGK
jgi:hypothetical protein